MAIVTRKSGKGSRGKYHKVSNRDHLYEPLVFSELRQIALATKRADKLARGGK